MAAELELRIGFGINGNSQGYLGGGWANAEADFTWTIDSESQLSLPRAEHDADYLLTLDVVPFTHNLELPDQRLVVSVKDTVVGASILSRPSLLAYRLPADLMRQQDRVQLTLWHPDAACPANFLASDDMRFLSVSLSEAKLYRLTKRAADHLPQGLMMRAGRDDPLHPGPRVELADWVRTRTGLRIPELAIQFESLGESCEFGLLQRRCDSEPLGLLRFSSTFLRNLIRGLDTEFDGLGKPEEVDPCLEGEGDREYMIHEQRYGLVYHTFIHEGQRPVALIRDQEATRLKFLRRKFNEDLKASEKIFVYKRNGPVSEAEILPLFQALRRHGDNTLLWVVEAENDHPPGTVEVAADGLLKGYIDHFAPDENAHDLSFDTWVQICVNALLLSRLRMADSPDRGR